MGLGRPSSDCVKPRIWRYLPVSVSGGGDARTNGHDGGGGGDHDAVHGLRDRPPRAQRPGPARHRQALRAVPGRRRGLSRLGRPAGQGPSWTRRRGKCSAATTTPTCSACTRRATRCRLLRDHLVPPDGGHWMITLSRSLATLLSLTLLVGSAPGAWAPDPPAALPPPPAGAAA